MVASVTLCCVIGIVVSAQAGERIISDAEFFSDDVLAEYTQMSETFAEYGFEVEVPAGERPSLKDIKTKYGDPDRSEKAEVLLGVENFRQMTETLVFHYWGVVGFGVRPDDADQRVAWVKRRER